MTTKRRSNGTALPDLERENVKLRKINQVLMTRVERSMDMQGSDFSLFEHAILLESKVRERTAALENALSDLRHSNQELAKAKAEADRANSGKTEFLAAASHDLLQPLNAARLFVAALAETQQSADNRSLIANIETAFASVEGLLNALLEISKLDAGVLSLEVTDLSLDHLLAGLSPEFEPLATEKGLAFHYQKTGVILRTDHQLFGRILRNFIGNAIRYTSAGQVLIEAKRISGFCRVDVVDSGSGIPDDQQDAIFEEFKRLTYGDGNQAEGFGLGLAIVKRIARLLDHDIEVSSSPGKGSRFSVLVPLGTALNHDDRVTKGLEQQPSNFRGAGVVLVIENDRAIRAGMAELLKRWGYQVVTGDGEQNVLTALNDFGLHPDLIIADYHLDDDQLGTGAVDGVRAALDHELPAIVITADRSPQAQADIARRELTLLAKPVKPAQLRAMIRHLIGEG